jgi:formate dehydrogenase maturation protein FdhE
MIREQPEKSSVREPPPTSCPFCGSTKVTAAGEKVDASTYWRCAVCGDMWNVSRLRGANRYSYARR